MLGRDNFADGNMLGWRTWGGGWSVADGKPRIGDGEEDSMALLNIDFADLALDAEVAISNVSGGSAGAVFRAMNPGSGRELRYDGYFAGLGIDQGGVVALH